MSFSTVQDVAISTASCIFESEFSANRRISYNVVSSTYFLVVTGVFRSDFKGFNAE